MFKDDIHIELNGYGDADNFILLSIDPIKPNIFRGVKQENIPLEHATPESIGNAVSEYLRKYLWEGDK